MGLGNNRTKEDGKPEVEKLLNGRFRITRRFSITADKDVWGANSGSEVFEDFASLDGASFGTGTKTPTADQPYTNARLVDQKVAYTPGSQEPTLIKVYETLTSTFVAERDDIRRIGPDGIETVSRQLIAVSGTAHGLTVGTSTYDSKVLSQLEVEEHDAYVRVVATYGGSGTTRTSTTTSRNGALSTIVIESKDAVPSTPAGYTLITTDIQDENGYQTYRYTFVKGTDQLISQRDETRNNGALLIRTISYITDAAQSSTPIATPSGYTLISEDFSEQDGYKVWTSSFAQGTGEISQSDETRENGALLIRTIEYLSTPAITSNPISTPAGYTLVSESYQDRDGHKVWRASFAQGTGEISQSDETRNNGSLLLRTIEYLSTPAVTSNPISTPAGYTLISESYQDRDGHKVWRASFAQGTGQISQRDDTRNNGNLNIRTIEYISTPSVTTTPISTPLGYTKIGEDYSERDGHKLWRNVFVEGSGTISSSSRPGPTSLPGSKINTIESLGAAVNPTGVLIETRDIEEDGYVRYIREAIEVSTGNKATWRDIFEVDVPGTVSLTQATVAEGTVATIAVVPPRRKKITATATISIETSPPTTGSQAYDIGEISCSVTSEQVDQKYIGTSVITSGGVTVYTDNYSYSTSLRLTNYPGCYLTPNTSATGTQTWNIGENENGDTLTETRTTTLTGSGATAATGYATTGVIRRSARPVLSTLSGTTYYEVITWTI